MFLLFCFDPVGVFWDLFVITYCCPYHTFLLIQKLYMYIFLLFLYIVDSEFVIGTLSVVCW